MSRAPAFAILALATAVGCSRAPEARQYELRGQILSLDLDRREVLIDHEDIAGFMPAMTMTYRVEDPSLLEGRTPGDLITATLLVKDTGGYLLRLTSTGRAPLKSPPDGPRIADADLLEAGEVVPDDALVDTTGTARPLASLRGSRVALTFMYTRCPLPDFCPLMDKLFAAVQDEIRTSPELADVRLVSVTLDPDYDVPAVLGRHAKAMGAQAGRWYFLTGKPDVVLGFAERFGVTAQSGDPDIGLVHNLRTAIIDPQGRLVTAYSGTMWTPAELVADLRKVPAPTR